MKVLFLCIHNADRSQMAEAFFNRMTGGLMTAYSAGIKPVENITLPVIQVMREAGLDMDSLQPKLMTLEMLEDADRIIAIGSGVNIWLSDFLPIEAWQIECPSGKPLEKVRQIRNEIKTRVEDLIVELTREEFYKVLTSP